MALFACVMCDVVDESELIDESERLRGLCTVCLGNTWHHRFDRKVYDPEHDVVTNRSISVE